MAVLKILLLCVVVALTGTHVSAFMSSKGLLRSKNMMKMAYGTSTVAYPTVLKADDNEKKSNEEEDGFTRLQKALEEADKNPKKRPPIYEPGSYITHIIAALAYVIPIVDSSDLGKYMFEAYPATLGAYSTVFGPIAGIYNGVPFLPFAVFFLMSYICRAPTFPVEVRFHFSQAFMLSIIQFVPSLLFGLLEKGGVPGMGVLYNTVFLWVMSSSLIMQILLLNPLSSSKNPFLINVVGWAMRYMNYTPDMAPK